MGAKLARDNFLFGQKEERIKEMGRREGKNQFCEDGAG